MKKMQDNFIDLVVTSPPYDNLRTYNNYDFKFEKIAKELFRVIKNGGVCVWVVGDQTVKGNETGTSFNHALYFKKIGFNLFDTMIYEKNLEEQLVIIKHIGKHLNTCLCLVKEVHQKLI